MLSLVKLEETIRNRILPWVKHSGRIEGISLISLLVLPLPFPSLSSCSDPFAFAPLVVSC